MTKDIKVKGKEAPVEIRIANMDEDMSKAIKNEKENKRFVKYADLKSGKDQISNFPKVIKSSARELGLKELFNNVNTIKPNSGDQFTLINTHNVSVLHMRANVKALGETLKHIYGSIVSEVEMCEIDSRSEKYFKLKLNPQFENLLKARPVESGFLANSQLADASYIDMAVIPKNLWEIALNNKVEMVGEDLVIKLSPTLVVQKVITNPIFDSGSDYSKLYRMSTIKKAGDFLYFAVEIRKDLHVNSDMVIPHENIVAMNVSFTQHEFVSRIAGFAEEGKTLTNQAIVEKALTNGIEFIRTANLLTTDENQAELSKYLSGYTLMRYPMIKLSEEYNLSNNGVGENGIFKHLVQKSPSKSLNKNLVKERFGTLVSEKILEVRIGQTNYILPNIKAIASLAIFGDTNPQFAISVKTTDTDIAIALNTRM